MNVVGFDTATSATTVALARADGWVGERRDDPPPGAHPGHATRLLEMLDALLEEAGVAWNAVDRVAVGLGPGTFTGLRVGVATARGLAQSLGAELVGVSSLAALARAALREHPLTLAVIDARRGEVFAAPYRAEDGEPLALAPPRAFAPEDAGAALREAAGEWWAVGDGAVRHRPAIEATGARVPDDASPLHLLSATEVCALGARQAGGAREIVPDYRRLPDAELALQDAGAEESRR